ncbi:hypothetical protein JOE51_006341 [Bradyrhizobium japonicum]|nr:hypothetical protein [Bradyrhizobium japonicum]
MVTLGTIAFGLVSGFVGWMLTEFMAKPFRKALDLAAEAKTLLIVYGNVQARYMGSATSLDAPLTQQQIPEGAEKRLSEAEGKLRELGARFQAFAATDTAASWMLRCLGIDLHEAGLAFIGLSNSIGIYGKQRADAQTRADQALRLRRSKDETPETH